MNGHSVTRQSLSFEEKMGLLDDRSLSSLSDTDSDNGIIDLDQHFPVAKWASYLLAPAEYLRSMRWRVIFVRLAWFFVPSFLQGRSMREQIRPTKMAPTAYLDGMRGLAALFVYFCHYSYQSFIIAKGWGCNDSHYDILKLPFLRLWYQGPPAVCVFFVISGYALSYRPLKFIRSRNTTDFSTTMSSLVFRRFIRLFLPTAISTFMIVCLIRMGVYEWTRDFAMDRAYMKNIVEPHPKRMEDGYAQFRHWAGDMFYFVHVFGWKPHGGSTNYDVHLWTIPVEFRCSLYLFLVIVATARLRTIYRFFFLTTVTLVTYRNSRWELVMFFFGMALAEWDHIRGAHVSPPALPLEEKQAAPAQQTLKTIFWNLVSILGMYLMCQPDDGGEDTPGWVYLSTLIPKWWDSEQYRYWQCTGAVVFVFAVGYSAFWQRVFNSAIVQYFGKLSYALYLMHGPAMHAIGYHWEKWAYSLTGVEGYWYNAGFALGACFCVPTVIWCADIFWRAVDIPTVKFAKWFESKVIVKAD
ncbi:hypothetical protein QQX98_007597 [Neonectria punicea]|uniref:Acyltransferase 3 domain-containing protein n=1 Tax=Neonectria punicea TaxID=979145 RepID=A0ABR1GXG6_9HYPO